MSSIKSSIQLFDNASPALRSMSNSLNVVINSFESMQRASNSSIDLSSIQLARDELAKVETNINEVENQIELAKNQQNNFNNSIRTGVNNADGLKSTFTKIVGAIGGFIGVKKVLDMSDELTQTTARINMMNDGLQTTQELQNLIYESAQRSRGSYQASADAVGKMGIMARDAFKSNAELVAFVEQLNKQFTIAGTNQEGVRAAMLQLTQAMGSGVLRGEELNSVFEQAPTIIQSIAEYLGVSIGEIRNLAKEGLITSDIVKNALLSTAEQTNAKFESMPKTFGQIMQSIQNTALMKFQPVLEKVNELLNTEKFQIFSNNAITAITDISNVCITAFNGLIGLANIISDNWSYVAPIIGGVTAALLLYKGAALATATANGILATATAVKAAKDALATGTTFAATAAQHGFNAALYACPITWIIVLIVALIAAIFLLCQWIADTTEVSNSAFGLITGAFTVMLAVCYNMLVGVINSIISALWGVGQIILSVIEWILNACMGGFNSFGGAVANLLGQIIGWFLELGKVVTTIIDAIFGTDWTKGLEDLKTSVTAWGKSDKAITLQRNLGEAPLIDRIEYGDAFKAGSQWGDGISKKLSNVFSGNDLTVDIPTMPEQTQYDYNNDLLSGISANTADTANDLAKLTDSMDWLEEDIRYLVDVAEREAINQFTTAEIKVETTNNNKIDSSLDLDLMIDKFNDGLLEVLQSAAEGVH